MFPVVSGGVLMRRVRLVLWLVCLITILGPASELFGQGDSKAPPAEPPVPEQRAAPTEKTLLDLFQTGGPLMWPLLFCSIGTIAVSVYCFVRINSNRMMPRTQVDAVGHHMQRREANAAYELCQNNPNSFSRTMAAALLKVNFERDLANKASMEQAAAEALGDEETKLMLWVNYLNVFATIGPMIGLLGTVTGMITSFDQLAAGRSEPQDLAGGIGEAMLTTAAGLIVGIPAMFAYFYFRNLLNLIISNLQKRVTFMIDVLSGELKLASAVQELEERGAVQTVASTET
jgi:biopolymer transport protein ExbB